MQVQEEILEENIRLGEKNNWKVHYGRRNEICLGKQDQTDADTVRTVCLFVSLNAESMMMMMMRGAVCCGVSWLPVPIIIFTADNDEHDGP